MERPLYQQLDLWRGSKWFDPNCLQVDEEPPIRANTTILLGNLAPHLSEAACKRVLLNAFTRALKDSFPPARVAGLKVSQK